MRTLILCGGKGTRAYPSTLEVPKPLLDVGGTPVLGHVMEIFARQGFTDFVLAAGFRAELIATYAATLPCDWTVEVLDTGEDTNTGGRVARCAPVMGETFFVTYSDGLGNVRLHDLVAFHHRHGGAATVTTVPLPSQYGTIVSGEDGRVHEFREKPRLTDHWINAGYMVMDRRAADRFAGDDFERDVLPALGSAGELYAYRHRGFWRSMDTYKDSLELTALCGQGPPPWALAASQPPAPSERPAPHPGRPGPQLAISDPTKGQPMHDDPSALPVSARALVTGATGFIGSHLVRRLLADGVEVHALSSTVSSVYGIRLVDVRDRVTMHEGNLADRGAMDALVDEVRPTHVFHLGAYTHVGKSWQRVDECVQGNVQGTVNLLQALDGSGYLRFVNMGTSEIYGDAGSPFQEDKPVRPLSPYAASKYAAECFCRVFVEGRGWPIVLLRPFNAYGPWQTADRIIPEVIIRALRGDELRMTRGRQTREFNFVEDLVDGIVRAASVPGVEGELFNLGCGEDVSIREVTTLVLDLLGNPVTPQFGALAERPTEIWTMRSDSTRARERLGWKPQHSLVDGLEKTIAWYRTEVADPSSPFIVR